MQKKNRKTIEKLLFFAVRIVKISSNSCVSTLNYSLFNWDWAEQERQKKTKNKHDLNEQIRFSWNMLAKNTLVDFAIFIRSRSCSGYSYSIDNLHAIGTAVKYGCWNCIGNGDGDGYENAATG